LFTPVELAPGPMRSTPALLAPGAILATLKPRPGCRIASGPNSIRRDGAISGRDWKREFDDPIQLPRGR
jgi:hypothetical protein